MSEDAVAVLSIALVVTVMFGWIGFNEPSWSRTYTTALRYRAALLLHIALYVGSLLVAFLVLRRMFHDVGNRDEVVAAWVAFAAIACVRGIPLLARWPRRLLHRVAGIPDLAARLAERLTDTPLERRGTVEAEARALLENRGIESDCDWLPAAQNVYQQLLNATVLFVQLRTWELDRQYARFVAEARIEFNRMRQEFDRVSFRYARAVANVERLGRIRYISTHQDAAASGEVDDHLRKLVKDLVSDVSEDVGVFYRDACQLLARGVMTTRWSRGARDAAFAKLGFLKTPHEPRSVIDVLASAAVLIYLGLWVFFLILPAERGSSVDAGALRASLELQDRVAVITLIVLSSLAVAIVPKLYWGFANAGLRYRTPVAFVIAAGVAAMLLALVINLVAGMIFIGGSAGALARTREGLPYLHSAFLTAATTAWLVQDHRWLGVALPRLRRLYDAATLGAVWIVSAALALWLRASMDPGRTDLQALAIAVAAAFVLGAVIGYVIPGSVRIEPVRRSFAPVVRRPPGPVVAGATSQAATARPAG